MIFLKFSIAFRWFSYPEVISNVLFVCMHGIMHDIMPDIMPDNMHDIMRGKSSTWVPRTRTISAALSVSSLRLSILPLSVCMALQAPFGRFSLACASCSAALWRGFARLSGVSDYA